MIGAAESGIVNIMAKVKEPIKKKDVNPNPLPLSLPLPAETTEQQDIMHAGQRRINLMWESTQAIIAVSITGAVIYTEIQGIQTAVLTNAFFLVVSMYLVRTNHSLTGGTGSPPKFEPR